MGSGVTELLSAYPHLQRFAQFLIDKTRSPVTKDDDRKEAQLVLKELRILASKAMRLAA